MTYSLYFTVVSHNILIECQSLQFTTVAIAIHGKVPTVRTFQLLSSFSSCISS